MGRFLDLRVSENSNTFDSTFTPVAVTTTPALMGVIGLQTQGVAGTGTNGLIVHLAGTAAISAAGAATIIFNIQRGPSTVFGGGTIIYTAADIRTTATASDILAFTAADLNAPAAAETAYTLFISATGAAVTRVGPEVFSGIAQNGLAPTP